MELAMVVVVVVEVVVAVVEEMAEVEEVAEVAREVMETGTLSMGSHQATVARLESPEMGAAIVAVGPTSSGHVQSPSRRTKSSSSS